MLTFTWDENNYIRFKHVQFFLLSSWHCAHQRWNSYLIDILIDDPMHADLIFQSYITQQFVNSNATQTKENSYHDQHLTDQFFPLAIEIFEYLHKQANMFLTCLCSYAIMSMPFETSNGQKVLPFFVSVIFFINFFQIMLQRIPTFSILNWMVMVGLANSQLPLFHDTPLVAMANHPPLPWLTYYKESMLRWRDFWHLFCINLTSFLKKNC